ncbi:MAG: HlyD family efflux transporter periplasmic adaptor subunit [Planctomycetaceae bacterium]|nr:HlyD family efflux transporter periplasmic adaptor subunit [Planctomycetaceae bacterium]
MSRIPAAPRFLKSVLMLATVGLIVPATQAQTSNRMLQPIQPRAGFNTVPFRAAQPTRSTSETIRRASVPAISAAYPSTISTQQLGNATSTGTPTSNLQDNLELKNCTISFIDDIMLPAKESGVILSLSVKEGDTIKAGTVVGKIDDDLFQQVLQQAKLRYELAADAAEDSLAIEAAEKKYKVAAIEARKTSGLADKGSKSESDRLMANYTMEIAALERDKAIREQQKAGLEKKLEESRFLEAKKHVEGHILQSEFDASVIKIMKKPQEYVQKGEAVMRIARMDRLWVQGAIEITDLNPEEVRGKRVTVTVQRARDETATFDGVITNVGLERQGLTRYMVKAEVQNRPIDGHWELQPLSGAIMQIHLDKTEK